MPGWIKGEMIAQADNRCITVFECNKNIGDIVNIRILDTKDSIYLAKEI